MKKNYITISFIFILVLLNFSCTPNLVQLTQNYAVVYNTHNVDDIVDLYTDDAVFEVSSLFSLTGKDRIRDITKYDSVLNIEMHIGNVHTNGDTAWFNLTETNDWLKISEIGEAYYSAIFVFKDGLISKIIASTKPETIEAFKNVLNPLMTWAKGNHPELLNAMMPEGKFIYNAENAMKNLILLTEWKESSR